LQQEQQAAQQATTARTHQDEDRAEGRRVSE
jgi:hypothetical protein